MTFRLSRRTLLSAAGAGVGAGLASTLPFARHAFAQKTQLTGVIWGGPWLDAAKTIVGKQDKAELRWELHTGGSGAVIPKIKAAWPNVPYDLVAQFNPLYYIWDREGWAEPFTFEEMPNLRDLPEEQFHRNAKGEIINVPCSIGGSFWGYRKDISPIQIKTMQDLLDPKLKGKLVVNDASKGLNNIGVSYAIGNGGDDRNMEPGWEFLKKLARSGNIGRVGQAEVDMINSINSGETVGGFANLTIWAAVAKNHPCEFLIKDRKEVPGFQVFRFDEGFMVPKTSPKKKEAKEFLNFFVSAENNEHYNMHLGYAPTNLKSKPSEIAKNIVFAKKEDRLRFTHVLDYDHLSTQRDAMLKRFETDIQPLLK